MIEKLFRDRPMYLVAAINVFGGLFGLYYYWEQLMATELYLWVFVPASPIATFLMAFSVYRNIQGKSSGLLDALAFIGNFKYGLWTVFCLLYYWDTFFTGNSVGLYSFMLLSHLGMAIQAFLVFHWSNIDLRPILIGFLWFGLNDLIDYSFGTHTELYTDYILPAEIAAYSLTLAAFFSGLVLIQKDRIRKWLRELRRV